MKSKDKNARKLFTNPFAVVQEKTLLTIGIFAFVVGLMVSFAMKTEIQVLRISPLRTLTLDKVLLNNATIVVLMTIAFFGIGKIVNPKTRFIDILNTVFIALIGVYISLFQNIGGFLQHNIDTLENAIKDGSIHQLNPPFVFIMISLLGFALFIYYIYLLFIGFKTATNAKKTWHYLLFFITLILVDFISSYFFQMI